MKKLLRIIVLAIALCSCKPTYQMGGHINCHPLTLPKNVQGWDYVGRKATTSGYGEWYDNHKQLFGYALEEDSTIYKNRKCLLYKENK